MGNLSLTGSFLIGAFVLMTLMLVFFKFTARQQDMVINELTQSELANIARIVDYDFDKLGYRVSSNPIITSIDSFSISFLADLDNNGTVDSVRYFKSTDQQGTYLNRRITDPLVKTWRVNISELLIEGFDSIDGLTYTAANIRSLAISFVLNNQRLANDSTENIGSYWRKRFYPLTL